MNPLEAHVQMLQSLVTQSTILAPATTASDGSKPVRYAEPQTVQPRPAESGSAF